MTTTNPDLDDTCLRCHAPMATRLGDDPTRYCDHCAHTMIDRLERENGELRAAVIAYFEWHGAEHEDEDCPMDDTCRCPMVLAINKALGPDR